RRARLLHRPIRRGPAGPRRHRDPGFRWSVRRGFPMTEPSTDTSQISSLESDPESRARKRGRRPRRRTSWRAGCGWDSMPGPLLRRLTTACAVVVLAVVLLFAYGFPCAVPSIPCVHDGAVGTGGTVG